MDDGKSPKETTGAAAVIDALVARGVDTFFANPGTSEIHLVSAIDAHPGARPVLCLFEGVATGAADGYARVCGRPAAVLLHLGPGLANGLANLHNARKARSPMIVVVGEHAAAHLQYETPLRSDLDALAGYAAKAVFRLKPGDDFAATVDEAVAISVAAPAGPVVLIAHTDVMWSATRHSSPRARSSVDVPVDAELVARAATMLHDGSRCALILGGDALSADALEIAARISTKTGCRLLAETFNARQARGDGLPIVERIPYFQEPAIEKLKPYDHLVLVGSRPPVAFFASPTAPSTLWRDDTQLLEMPHDVASVAHLSALDTALAEQSTGPAPVRASRRMLDAPSGPLTPKSVWAIVNRLLPEDSLVSEEAGVSSLGADDAMSVAARHVWMNLTGGSIGQALPVATGAALAAPDRVVVGVQGDGGAMYTLQALWTQVREKTRVINVILRNDRYAILEFEVKRHGLPPLGSKGASMFSLSNPTISWTAVAASVGMSARSVDTAEDFAAAFAAALAADGPCLIEAVLSSGKPRKTA